MSGDIWHVYAYEKPGPLAPGVRAIRYGQALGGRPCADAYLHDPPRNGYDQEWIEQDLFGRLAPGASIHKLYERDRSGGHRTMTGPAEEGAVEQ